MKNQLDGIFDSNKFSPDSSLSDLVSRGYVYSIVDPSRNILFVGINPSYLEESPSYGYDPMVAVTEYPKHYKKFSDIAEKANVGTNWNYLDLLYCRETDQNKVSELLLKRPEGLKFLCDQLRLTMIRIEELKPDLIVVCNNAARQFFGIDKNEDGGIWMGYDFEFKEEIGADVIIGVHSDSISESIKSTNLIGTPVLFSGVLTYMDSSTKNRLSWHMRHVLNWLNK